MKGDLWLLLNFSWEAYIKLCASAQTSFHGGISHRHRFTLLHVYCVYTYNIINLLYWVPERRINYCKPPETRWNGLQDCVRCGALCVWVCCKERIVCERWPIFLKSTLAHESQCRSMRWKCCATDYTSCHPLNPMNVLWCICCAPVSHQIKNDITSTRNYSHSNRASSSRPSSLIYPCESGQVNFNTLYSCTVFQ